MEVTQVLVQFHVISRVDHCKSLLAGFPLCAIRPLHPIRMQLYDLCFSVNPVSSSLSSYRIRFKTLTHAYKAKNGHPPTWRHFKPQPCSAPEVPLSLQHSLTHHPSRYKEDKHHDSSLSWHPPSHGCLNNWVTVCLQKKTKNLPLHQAHNGALNPERDGGIKTTTDFVAVPTHCCIISSLTRL